jgi:hypothetical protein
VRLACPRSCRTPHTGLGDYPAHGVGGRARTSPGDARRRWRSLADLQVDGDAVEADWLGSELEVAIEPCSGQRHVGRCYRHRQPSLSEVKQPPSYLELDRQPGAVDDADDEWARHNPRGPGGAAVRPAVTDWPHWLTRPLRRPRSARQPDQRRPYVQRPTSTPRHASSAFWYLPWSGVAQLLPGSHSTVGVLKKALNHPDRSRISTAHIGRVSISKSTG